MAKKNYYYVLVFTDCGPIYVTGLGDHHTAYWDELKEPMSFSKSIAEEITLGLRCNWHCAVTVYSPVELTQPYCYDEYEIVWNNKEEEE